MAWRKSQLGPIERDTQLFEARPGLSLTCPYSPSKNSTVRFFLYFCALAAGALLPMQAGINAQLK
ncbi:MAG TPA: hypothetical protein VHS80_05685, partial [Chthoniobacterales bacterium]|nr:hypothetical protein [Chthoniobacterales bacterium]